MCIIYKIEGEATLQKYLVLLILIVCQLFYFTMWRSLHFIIYIEAYMALLIWKKKKLNRCVCVCVCACVVPYFFFFFFCTKDGIYDCAWSESNENHLASACGDGTIKLWWVFFFFKLVWLYKLCWICLVFFGNLLIFWILKPFFTLPRILKK